MKVNRSVKSPNFDTKNINVEFLVIHYTACGLQSTLEIFRNPERKVSSHLVLSNSGEVYEVVKCWEGEAQRAWHAGKSIWTDQDKTWENFNDFSIGLEIVNNNGNIIEYSSKQYESLLEIIKHLRQKYPALEDPNRILGHEHIAGWRGKIDPGWMFNWEWLFANCYPTFPPPQRLPTLPEKLLRCSEKFLGTLPENDKSRSTFWQTLNETLEAAVELGHTPG
jgi:N-acetylmuramoyl-L-alanine amidase